ncbi:MAG: cation diffusion facilitator family transporter [Butyrivibrio sp.]|nr:cation diffusion facilitator family transporter [Butyrivibrio sp.]
MKQDLVNVNVCDKTDTQVAMHVSIVSIIVNISLSIFKLLAGIFAKSGAMISDAVHSASDVFSTIIVMIGVTIAGKESDKEHPYGHERLECVASLCLAVVLAITGIGIGKAGFTKIISGNYSDLAIPGVLALVAAGVSIVVKEWMYWFTRGAAKKINSGALMADAWHHRSDALSSIGALIGIFGSRMGFPVMDALASLIICIFIEKAAFDIFKDAIDKMVDKSCPEEVVDKMKKAVMEVGEVKGVDDIKTRLFGAKIYVEVEIAVDANETLINAHRIAEEVHDHIEEVFPEVKHCMVHVNPDMEKTEQIHE